MSEENQEDNKSENCTYFLCPDKTCELFYDMSRHVACDGHCPHQEKMRKLIVCRSCHKWIELPGNHCSFIRVDCPGCRGWNFQRMSGNYYLLRERPEGPFATEADRKKKEPPF